MKPFLAWYNHFNILYQWLNTLFLKRTLWKNSRSNIIVGVRCSEIHSKSKLQYSFLKYIADWKTPTSICVCSIREVWIKVFRRIFLPNSTLRLLKKELQDGSSRKTLISSCTHHTLILFKSFFITTTFFTKFLTTKFDMCEIWTWKGC